MGRRAGTLLKFNVTILSQVRELHGDGKTIKWADALDTVRLKYIRKKYESENKDYLVAIITEVYKKFRDHVQDQHMVASFKSQVSVKTVIL